MESYLENIIRISILILGVALGALLNKQKERRRIKLKTSSVLRQIKTITATCSEVYSKAEAAPHERAFNDIRQFARECISHEIETNMWVTGEKMIESCQSAIISIMSEDTCRISDNTEKLRNAAAALNAWTDRSFDKF